MYENHYNTKLKKIKEIIEDIEQVEDGKDMIWVFAAAPQNELENHHFE